ncbi:hypothetical protein K2173_020782 [Erythroxylum novogranatense]|uniref:Reticulon-like protein n=1 Tax=Erythroxylum novogranatense TaxID=1862640 RepID=A0AAV8TLM7_9ROSI|nr:hypothetical protein K2173_020782 [Erythroxylum novogranatense]
MDVSRRRAGVKSSVVAGSVWESRMKLDDVKGGVKVFNGEENAEESSDSGVKKAVRRSLTASTVAASGKRKTWKSENFEGKTETKNCEEQCSELSVSADGIKKSSILVRKGRFDGNKELSRSVDGSPVQVKNGRSEGMKEVSVSVDGIDKSPIQVKKVRSEANKESPIQTRKSRSDVKEDVESRSQLRKAKSDSVEAAQEFVEDLPADNVIESNSVQLRKAESEPAKVLDESVAASVETVCKIETNPPETEGSGSEEICREFGVCQEVITSTQSDEAPKPLMDGYNDDHEDIVMVDDEEFEGDEEEEDIDEEIDDVEIEKNLEIKEIDIPEEKPKKVETSLPEEKPKKVETSFPEQKPKQTVNQEKKLHQFNNRAAPTSSTVNKRPPPVIRRATFYQNFTKPTPTPVANRYSNFPETHNKLQNLVDLVMWRDISRSAFVFGIGTFVIISSSYTKDINVSCISVFSYLGLVYLAAIFLYRSLINRGVVDVGDGASYVLGEDEAIWIVKLVLPYLNEFLLKIKALFSGDPSTTMKMAVLLFVLARCGNSITIWKMAKLGFFGVFTIPKVCTLYSSQLTAYGKFWIRRFGDAWGSCTHKKAVALAIFSLVWNLSSMVARVWAVFMMFVAVRYYQQSLERDDDWAMEEVEEEEEAATNETIPGVGQRQGGGPTVVINNKTKWRY